MKTPVIRAARQEDEAAVVNVVTLPFSTDLVTRWANPQSDEAVPGGIRS